MKKVLLVATVQSHIAQFHKPLINLLHQKGCVVDVAAHNNLELKNNLKLDEPDNIFEIPFSRSPFSVKNIKAYKMLKKLIDESDYDVVHCNTPVGGILTRIAGRKKRKEGTKIVYQAHGFHFFKGGSKLSWLIWYPIEKFFSKFADLIIVINKMDFEIASRKFKANNVEKVPGVGVNLKQFTGESNVNLKKDYSLSDDCKMILSVGELNKNKNQQVIIKAIAYANDKNIHYFIAGNGPLKEDLVELAKKLNVSNQVHFLGYRRDLIAIYNSVDLFVLPSLREGLGMASIEAMSFGLPIVTSNRHGINDYSENNVSGYKYDPKDYKGFAAGIKKILYDDELRNRMSANNKKTATKFSLESSIEKMEEIYNGLLGVNCEN